MINNIIKRENPNYFALTKIYLSGKLLKPLLLILCSIFLQGMNLYAEENGVAGKKKPMMNDLRIATMKNNTNVVNTGEQNKTDSLEKLLNIFYYDQFRHFQDPRAPYFMFLSKNGDLALGVGGQV